MQKYFALMPAFLRDPDAFYESIHRDENIREKAGAFAVVALFSFMVYGFTVGLGKSPVQALSSSLKIPILFLATMLFCLPSLYFFSLALLRTPLRMMQVLVVVLSGITVTAFLLLGLAPITLFFVLTSTNYEFFQLLAVAFVGISASIGVYFLWRGMTRIEMAGDPATARLGRRILSLWILLYAFVGTQLTWRLSPFIGRPEDPFYLIRPSRDNFYMDVLHAMQGALQIPEYAWYTPMALGGMCLGGILMMILVSGIMRQSTRRPPQPVSPAPQP